MLKEQRYELCYRDECVNYQELQHNDQVDVIIDELKQRIIYGTNLPNMCQRRKQPMVQVNGQNMDNDFKSLNNLNKLYDIWKEMRMEG